MRIGEGPAPGPAETANSKVRNTLPAQSVSRQAAPGQAGSGDIVAVGQGRELLHLALQKGAASRQERVEEVRAALAGGTYQVNSQDVSRAIVEDILSGGVPETS